MGRSSFAAALIGKQRFADFASNWMRSPAPLIAIQLIDFATVVTRTSESGENQLVAYVLPKVKEAAPTANELQQHLLRSLPDYMVPSAFFCLDALPLSSNGKIDLARLAQSTDGRMLERVAAKGPASSVEEKVLAIVRGILKNDEVGTADNFFLAGGHSLLGTQLLVRLRSEFGVDLALRQLFEAPTAEDLASLVEKLLGQAWLAKVWAEVLRRSEVQLDDNFFALGGESELLAAVQRRIAVEFGRQISIHQLVANPTVRAAIRIDEQRIGNPANVASGCHRTAAEGSAKQHFLDALFQLRPVQRGRRRSTISRCAHDGGRLSVPWRSADPRNHRRLPCAQDSFDATARTLHGWWSLPRRRPRFRSGATTAICWK